MGPTEPQCSIAATLDVVGDRWTLLILRDLFRGVHRFSELQGDLGIARNLLTDRLNRLHDHGLVEKVPYQQRPLRSEYRLTRKGADLSPALISLMAWGDHWYADAGAPVELVHDRCGTPIERQPRCPRCDEAVGPGHIRSRPGPGSLAAPTPVVAAPGRRAGTAAAPATSAASAAPATSAASVTPATSAAPAVAAPATSAATAPGDQ